VSKVEEQHMAKLLKKSMTRRSATFGRYTSRTLNQAIDAAFVQIGKDQRVLKKGQQEIEELRKKSEATMVEVRDLLKSL
jgi:hypothetical protein